MSTPARFEVLLAKSIRPDHPVTPSATLGGHLADVTAVAQVIAEEWGERTLETLGLPPDPWLARLRMALPRAAFLHDIGKANDHFQGMLYRRRVEPQALRHEWISLWLILVDRPIADWLLDGCDQPTRFAVLAAAAGHHLKLAGPEWIKLPDGSGDTLRVLAGHRNVAEALRAAAVALDLREPPVLTDRVVSLIARGRLAEATSWLRDAGEWWEEAATSEERLFVALLKALVIGADVAGSAVPRANRGDCRAWARRALETVCTQEALTAAFRQSLGENEVRPFQNDVAATDQRVTLVRAGCGSGKTAAAYAWAAQKATGRKVFFTYPTTGTTTEGYLDNVRPVGDIRSALVHSRASVDLADLLENGDEQPSEAAALQRDRLLGLESWTAQVTVSTVDAVLSLMQNGRRGLFGSPAIANGAFIFDEIHQYDERLFDALEHFLGTFRGAPTLLMTASLQPDRLQRLQAVLARLGESLGDVKGPGEWEDLPRYILRQAHFDDDTTQAVRSALANGQRVLWVSNRVRRCQDVGRMFDDGETPVEPYHSRYRYAERTKRHRAVIDGFPRESAGHAILASTTQVCESSLNLSADLLITDLAPIPALIQRLGRLNRWAEHDSPAREALILEIEPGKERPYEPGDLELARRWLATLGEGPHSQSRLAREHEAIAIPRPPQQRAESEWLAGGACTGVGQLRESGTTVSVIRQEDVGDGSLDTVTRNSIPMPVGPVMKELPGWKRVRSALVVPSGRLQYDERWGGEWL